MADGVNVHNGAAGVGSAFDVVTDELVSPYGGATAQVQAVKLLDGTANSATPAKISAAGALNTDNQLAVVRKQVTATVSTTPAYTAKDAIGALLTFSNAARVSAGGIVVEAVQIVDKGQQMAAMDLLLFDRSITAPTDNAVFNPSDTETTYCVGGCSILASDYADLSTNSVAAVTALSLSAVLNGTDLFGVLVARGTPTYTSTTDIVVTLTIRQL